MPRREGLPSVSVPVLSKATTRASRIRCRASPRRNSTPSSEARPVPTMIETGTASPMAQGQATTSTETAATTPLPKPPPKASQSPSVTSAAAITAGTKTWAMRSTRFWIGSFEPCASSTAFMIRASIVSPPVAVARITSAAAPLTVPPITASPGRRVAGIGSPVTMLSSMSEVPSTTTPSTGRRSPGLSSTSSPTCSALTGMEETVPSGARIRASRTCSPASRRIAAEARPRARASIQRPARIRVTMTAAASK